ncbi:MAG TPA: DMT family transporter [Sphingomonas sp.]
MFSLMNVAIKLAERFGAGLVEILFWRQFGASMLVVAVVASGPGFGSLRTERLPAHLLRCAVGLGAMALSFSALLALPLAEATTIGFSMPIFATLLGALVLREPTGRWRWAAVLVGFAGIVVVAQPGGDRFPLWGAALGLAGSFATAGVMILLRRIGRTEAPMTTVFWFSVLSLVPLGAGYAFLAQAHPWPVWALMLAIGLLGGVAQLAMTGSLARGPVSVVVPMDYTSLVWAALLGWLVFDTLPSAATWIGAPIVIASGLVIVWRERVRHAEAVRTLVPEE